MWVLPTVYLVVWDNTMDNSLAARVSRAHTVHGAFVPFLSWQTVMMLCRSSGKSSTKKLVQTVRGSKAKSRRRVVSASWWRNSRNWQPIPCDCCGQKALRAAATDSGRRTNVFWFSNKHVWENFWRYTLLKFFGRRISINISCFLGFLLLELCSKPKNTHIHTPKIAATTSINTTAVKLAKSRGSIPRKGNHQAPVHRRKLKHVLFFLLYTYDSKKCDLVWFFERCTKILHFCNIVWWFSYFWRFRNFASVCAAIARKYISITD